MSPPMSSAHEGAHAHDAHAHDDFDPNPPTELGADEPRTPLWLSMLGLALFTLGALYWFAGSGDAPSKGTTASSVAAAVAPAAQKPAADVAAAKPRQLSRAEVDQLQKQIEAMRAAKGLAAPGGGDPHGGH